MPWGAAGALRRFAWPPAQRDRVPGPGRLFVVNAQERRCSSAPLREPLALPEALVGAELKLPRALRAVSLPGCTVGALRCGGEGGGGEGTAARVAAARAAVRVAGVRAAVARVAGRAAAARATAVMVVEMAAAARAVAERAEGW